MPRGSDVPSLSERADIHMASRPGGEAAALLLLAHGEGDPTKHRHVRTTRRAAPVAACLNSIVRVAFTRGEVQLAARGTDLMSQLAKRAVRKIEAFEQETGEQIVFHQPGALKIARLADHVEQLKGEVIRGRRLGTGIEMISPQEARAKNRSSIRPAFSA